jgi:hypothetical protein
MTKLLQHPGLFSKAPLVQALACHHFDCHGLSRDTIQRFVHCPHAAGSGEPWITKRSERTSPAVRRCDGCSLARCQANPTPELSLLGSMGTPTHSGCRKRDAETAHGCRRMRNERRSLASREALQ